LLNIRGFLNAGPRKNFSFKPVRSAKKVADPWSNWYQLKGFMAKWGIIILSAESL